MHLLALLFLLFFIKNIEAYNIPEPKFEVLSPKGFRFSIPDDTQIKLFIFHGALNRKLSYREIGDFSGKSISPLNGKWFYQNLHIKLKPKDVIYYWLYVQYGNKSFEVDAKQIRIRKRMLNELFEPFYEDSESLTGSSSVVFKQASEECPKSLTLVKGQEVCKATLIFEENFDDDHLNEAIWEREIKFGGYDEEFVMLMDRSENLYIENKQLCIEPSLTIESGFKSVRGYNIDLGKNCTETIKPERDCKRMFAESAHLPPIVSAKIRTKNHFSFRYGIVEVRAKLPKGDWLFPQIFLQPIDPKFYGIEYESGQMRIAFIHGNEELYVNGEPIDGRTLMGGVILTNSQNNRILMSKSRRLQHLGNDFHNYTLRWTNDTITMEVDGNEYGTISSMDLVRTFNSSASAKITEEWKSGNTIAPFDQEFCISLGISAGGISDFPDNIRTVGKLPKPWQNLDPKNEIMFWKEKDKWFRTWKKDNIKMKIDYVKVWAL